MLKSIMGRVVDSAAVYKRAKMLPASGFGKHQAATRYSGYHKQMERSEMVALTRKLQRQAAR